MDAQGAHRIKASYERKPTNMKTQRIAIALTVINLALLAAILIRLRPAVAEQGIAPVLRGRSLEIIDDQEEFALRLSSRRRPRCLTERAIQRGRCSG